MECDGRRKFLGFCLGGLVLAAAGAGVYPLFKYLSPRKPKESAGKVEIPEKAIPAGDAKFFDYGGSTAVVINTRDKGLIVLSAVCTHLGCIVQWQKDRRQFLCPCHAGRYTENGDVISGPPPRPLPKLPFSVSNGIITVG
jgi:cytochrome b6-f complex iron-sulfur subunit